MNEIPVHPMVQKMAEKIPDPIPGDDKSHINNYIFDLEMPDDEPGISVMKVYASDNLGRMALRYDAEFLVVCGVIPHLKKALYSKHNHVIAATARACSCIARSGGAQMLIDEGFSYILMSLASDSKRDFYVRDACARAFGWIFVMRDVEAQQK